jgi:hypothetical protein
MELLKIMAVLIMVESGGDKDAIGDDGLAFGILQMHQAYVQDAAQWARMDWKHSDAFDPSKAEDMFLAYMGRYAKQQKKPKGMSYAEFVSRIHNGGPRGYMKTATDSYWGKVNKIIASQTN